MCSCNVFEFVVVVVVVVVEEGLEHGRGRVVLVRLAAYAIALSSMVGVLLFL